MRQNREQQTYHSGFLEGIQSSINVLISENAEIKSIEILKNLLAKRARAEKHKHEFNTY